MMVWLIRNNKGRLSKSLGIRGLRPMASVLTRAIGRRGNKDVILVDKDGNLVERPAPVTAPKVSTDDLDAVTQTPRLKGPGARAARAPAEPNMSPEVLGRKARI
jgi:hypothetical protein